MASTNEPNATRVKFARASAKVAVILKPPVAHPSSVIDLGAVIYPNVVIGKNAHIHAGVVIGARGFSFGFTEEHEPITIEHWGGVIIGDNVEIGANSVISQGTLKPTLIADFVKIDALCHVAHNVVIHEKCCLASGTILGGGAVLHPKVWCGTSVNIMTKALIGEFALLGNGANVLTDVNPGAIMVGNPAKVLRYRI